MYICTYRYIYTQTHIYTYIYKTSYKLNVTWIFFYCWHYYKWPSFSTLASALLHQAPHSTPAWPSPHRWLCPRAMHICSLANLFRPLTAPSPLRSVSLSHVFYKQYTNILIVAPAIRRKGGLKFIPCTFYNIWTFHNAYVFMYHLCYLMF